MVERDRAWVRIEADMIRRGLPPFPPTPTPPPDPIRQATLAALFGVAAALIAVAVILLV